MSQTEENPTQMIQADLTDLPVLDKHYSNQAGGDEDVVKLDDVGVILAAESPAAARARQALSNLRKAHRCVILTVSLYFLLFLFFLD
jgi:hypothetical protein